MRRSVIVALLVSALGGAALVRAQQGVGQVPSPLPLTQTVRDHGTSVTPAFEGWYYDKDGSIRLLVGYFNRNLKQEFDIPAGPNNHIDPGGPDMGQPTHFLTGRQWGMFMVPIPRDFKPDDSYVWTITANGQTTSIPLRTKADYVMSPFTEIAVGNTPPVLKFDPNGKTVQGPLANLATATTAGCAARSARSGFSWAAAFRRN
jgi:hypothetical protein